MISKSTLFIVLGSFISKYEVINQMFLVALIYTCGLNLATTKVPKNIDITLSQIIT